MSSSTSDMEFRNLTEEEKQFVSGKKWQSREGNRIIESDAHIERRDEKSEISNIEWASMLKEKYENLKQCCNEIFPGLWLSLEFELSIQKILNIEDCTLPFAGIVLGRPSSLKTLGIELFRNWHHVYYTDNFSAKSFVSHSTSVKREKLAEIDMLPKIKNKLFLSPELSPTFAKRDDDLIETLGILTRILDGRGYESDTGAHGHRGYNEPMMFVWIGAAVDIPHKVHKYLGTLGPKLYFLRLPETKLSEDDYCKNLDKDFSDRVSKIQAPLSDYLNWFEKAPNYKLDKRSRLNKMSWDFSKDDKAADRFIYRLGNLLAHLRGVVTTWETRETQGLDYAYAMSTIEDPSRARTQLRNLARGHALSLGRNYITIQDLEIVVKVVLSTASMERVRVLELLLHSRGKLSTSQIMVCLNTSNNTAKRTMAEFKALGLVNEFESEHDNSEKIIKLRDEFDWFLTEEFLKLLSPP